MSRHILLRFLLASAVLILVPVPTLAADHPPGVIIADRHKITAELTAGDKDSYAIVLCERDLLSVGVKAGKGAGDLAPTILLRRPDGKAVSIGDWMKKFGTSKPALKKFPVPVDQSGVWTITVGTTGGTGPYTVSIRIKRAKPVKSKALTVPAGAVISLPVVADEGGLLTVSVKEKKSGPLASIALLDPDGVALPPEKAPLVRKKSKVSAKSIPIERACERYTLQLTGDPAADTIVDVTLSLKYPRPVKRKATLPPELKITSITPEVLRQAQTGVTVTLAGENFLPDTAVDVNWAGARITASDIQVPGKAVLTFDVDPYAPYGERHVTFYPPPSLGEPVLVRNAFVVEAPVPSITSVSGGPLRQEHQGLKIEILGDGFRDGGGFYFSQEKIVVVSTTIPESTRAVVTIDVPFDTPVGPVHITYSQPTEGGGSSVSAFGVLELLYPVPDLVSVTPNRLRRGESTSVTVIGSGFREGGVLTLGSQVTMKDVKQVSATEYRFDIEIAETATAGDRDVVYTHPSDGGGEEARIDDGFRVLQIVETTLTGIDTGEGDAFGHSVAADGGTIVVGAPYHDGGATGSGAAYVYVKSSGKWVRQAKLTQDKAAYGDNFGEAVAIDGDTIAVSAPRKETGDLRDGVVYVFTRSEGTWTQQAKLVADDTNDNRGVLPMFGDSVDLDGDDLVVGASRDNPVNSDNGTDQGGAYVFVRSGTSWSLQKKLSMNNLSTHDRAGSDLAIDAGTVAVGVYGHGGPLTSNDVGGVAVQARPGKYWSHQAWLFTAEAKVDEKWRGNLGRSVALDAGTLAASDESDLNYSGAVHVFTGQSSAWTLQQKIVPTVRASSDYFGSAVDLVGDVLLIGARSHNGGASFGGAMFVFRRAAGKWTQSELFYPSTVKEGDWFGTSVAIGDGFFVGGAPRADPKGDASGSITIVHED